MKAKRYMTGMPAAVLSAVIIAAAAVSGCGDTQAQQDNAGQTEATVASEAAQAMSDLINGAGSSAASDDKGEEESEAETESEAEESAADAETDSAQAETTEERTLSEDPENAEDVFEIMSGWDYEFASGVGAWATSLEVKPDGSFSGMYYDADMGDTGEGYELYGTYYRADFSGRFTDAEKVAPRIFRVTIDELDYEEEPGREEIKDGQRIIYTEAYGLSGTDTVMVYLPGAEVETLPEAYMGWVKMTQFNYYLTDTYLEDVPGELTFCGIYNEAEDGGFVSYGRQDRNRVYLTNRAAFPDLVPEVQELHEDGTYRYVDMDRYGMHAVTNLCFRTPGDADSHEDQEHFINVCLNELGEKAAEESLYYYGADMMEYSAPMLLVNGIETLYAGWTSGSNEDTRFHATRMFQNGEFTYVYDLSSSEYDNLMAGEAGMFYLTSLTLSGSTEHLSSAPAGGAPDDLELHTMLADLIPGRDKKTVQADELVWVSWDDEELQKKYGIDQDEITNDYAIAENDDVYETYELADDCPIYVQYPEENILRSLLDRDAFYDYISKTEDGRMMYLYLDENDRIVYIYEPYTP
ncbi:MAG: hypothetical protein IIY96_06370 [Lachnospiraceae bacterium]|jgi:hypothetical protein|nr:hypothetical protein [Lachnospiraceae bacterium]